VIPSGASTTTTAALPEEPAGGASTPPATALSVVILSPKNGAWTGAGITIKASASAGVALKEVRFYGDGVLVDTSTCATVNCTAQGWWTTGALAGGPHTMRVEAVDVAGHVKSASITINK
jgi:hypothetical protein